MGKVGFVVLLLVCFYNIYTISYNEGYKDGRVEAGDFEEGYQVGYENAEIMQKIKQADLKEYNDSIKDTSDVR